MRYRFLGHTGIQVSELCLGAMPFGGETDQQTSHAILDRFVDAGGDFVDTSDIYNSGRSEEVLGSWLKTQQRDRIVVTTKVRWNVGGGRNDAGLSRRHLLAAAEASLRRLGTDYLDLYQVHGWDNMTRLEDTVGALDALVRSGKVRYVGVSNHAAWQVQKAVDIARFTGQEPFVSVQPLYNLLDRQVEDDLVPVALGEGLSVLPWSPLRGGWLSGRFRRGMTAPPAGTRVQRASEHGSSEAWQAYDTEDTWRVIDELHAVASELGRPPAQVALNWLLRRPAVTAPIIGCRTLEHLEVNIGASDWSLPDEHEARLTKASARPVRYPFSYANVDRSLGDPF